MEKHGPPWWQYFLVAVALLVVVAFGTQRVVHNQAQLLERKLDLQVAARANGAREYLLVAQRLLHGVEHLMAENLALALRGALHHPAAEQIKNYPGLGIYAIAGSVDTGESLKLVGVLSGQGQAESIDTATQAEINAALALNPLFSTLLQAIPDTKWLYYTSARNFVFLAPATPVRDEHFQRDNLARAFWLQATPENNPDHSLAITEAYADAGGKGPLISMSLPVYLGEVFVGVITLDVGLDTLMTLLTKPQMLGDSALLDEHGHVIFKAQHMHDTLTDDSKGYYIAQQVVLENQMVLLHKVPRRALMLEALRESWVRISQVFFVGLLLFLAFYLWQLVRRIRLLADTDPLTGLMNRRAMERIAAALIGYNNRYQQKMCVLILDLDHFKKINDSYGHQVGDRVLEGFAALLESTVRESDQLSRHGGEEFLVVLPNTELQEAFQMAERLRNMVHQAPLAGASGRVTVSIGCAELLPGENYSNILKRADDALYRAKNNGRNQTAKAF